MLHLNLCEKKPEKHQYFLYLPYPTFIAYFILDCIIHSLTLVKVFRFPSKYRLSPHIIKTKYLINNIIINKINYQKHTYSKIFI